MSMTADDFFTGGGVSAKFDTVGVTVGGPITRVGEPMQQRDFTTGQPKHWDDGSPMMQLPVDVKTNLRDPEVPNDDGNRTLYIKGEMQKAIRDAVRRSGEKGLRVGGVLTVTYSGDGQARQRGLNPPKLYTATYEPPSAADNFLGTTTTTTTAPAAPAAPAAPVGVTRDQFPHLTPEQLAAVNAAGLSAEQVRQMFASPAA